MRRSLREDLELITYVVVSETGSHRVEEWVRPGGPYHSLGTEVDLEVEVRTYVGKDGHPQTSLRTVRYAGEF
jgi:hypothetical protein